MRNVCPFPFNPLQALLADTYSVRETKVHENGKVSKFTTTHEYIHTHTQTLSYTFIHFICGTF